MGIASGLNIERKFVPLLNLDAEIDLNVRVVPVPELGAGATVCIGEMTADEQDDRLWKPWNDFKDSTKQENNRRFRSFVVAACMCDENRNFTYEPEKLVAIAGIAWRTIFLLWANTVGWTGIRAYRVA